MKQTHAKLQQFFRNLKLDGDGINAAATPGVKAVKEQLDKDAALESSKTTPYRAVAAGANYLAADRLELQFAAEEICRWMAHPTESALNSLKRLGRYVAGCRMLIYIYIFILGQTCRGLIYTLTLTGLDVPKHAKAHPVAALFLEGT